MRVKAEFFSDYAHKIAAVHPVCEQQEKVVPDGMNLPVLADNHPLIH